jgi:hypothetical protein
MEDDNSSKSDDDNKEKVGSQKEDQSWPDLQIAKGFHSVDTIEEVLRLWSHSKRTTLLFALAAFYYWALLKMRP